jgi:zinc protease
MPKVKVAVREEVARFLKDGITEKELATAVAGYLRGKEVDRTSDQGLAFILAETVEAGRTMDYYADLEQKMKALTPQQVVDAFRKHLDTKRLIVVTAGDFKPMGTGKQPAAGPQK